jgi:hypothetical protein
MRATLEQYKKYGATVNLNGFEKFAVNVTVEHKFKGLGFTNVVSTGSGATRKVSGVWSKETQEIEVPEQVSEITQL